METEQIKETKKSGIGMKVLMGLMVLIVGSLAFAGVVSYLSNTAQANVNVSSPMTIQFAEVNFGNDLTEPNIITVVNGASYLNAITLNGITGLNTIDLGVKVINNSKVLIASKTLKVTVSNNLGNVDLNDITSLRFFDSGASVGSPSRIWQDLVSLGVDNGATVTYTIPINSLAAGTTYKYPVTMTFGVVAPTDYNVTATLMNASS
jgi:hypothetical protein